MEDEEVSPLLTSTSAEHYNSSTHESAVIRRYLHSSQDCFEEEEAATIEHAITLPVGTLSTVAVSVALGLVSGTVYGFGRYSRDLKSVLDLNQYQIQQLGIFLDTGNEFPVAGWIYDYFGPKWSCCLAAIVVFLSYGALQYGLLYSKYGHPADHHDNNVSAPPPPFDVNNVESHSEYQSPTLVFYLVAFFGVGLGSGLGYMAALGCTTRQLFNTPYLGRTVGIIASGYGLSSTLVGMTYHKIGLHYFFGLWACLVAGVNVVGVQVFSSFTRTADASSQNTSSFAEREQATPWNTWKKNDFWILLLTFASMTGCGLFIINNISTMVQSLEQTDSLASVALFVLSGSNVFGRIVMGILSDQFCELQLLQISCIIMAVGLWISFVYSGALQLLITVGFVSLAFGGAWVLIVPVVSNRFGKTNFGRNYGLIAMGPALSGMIFNTMSAWLYQSQIAQSDSDHSGVCIGPDCYRISYLVTSFAAMLGYFLVRRLR